MEYEFEPEREPEWKNRLTRQEIESIKAQFRWSVQSVHRAEDGRHKRRHFFESDQFQEVPKQHFFFLTEAIYRLALWTARVARSGALVPSVIIEGQEIPVDALGSFNSDDEYSYVPSLKEVERETVESGLIPSLMTIEEAHETVVEEASRSLADGVNISRAPLENFGDNFDNYRTGAVPGLAITIHTNHSRVPVLYSMASFMRYNQRLGGSLSTPVSSYLNPGRYIFGVQLSSGPIYETAGNRIPPDFTIYTATA